MPAHVALSSLAVPAFPGGADAARVSARRDCSDFHSGESPPTLPCTLLPLECQAMALGCQLSPVPVSSSSCSPFLFVPFLCPSLSRAGPVPSLPLPCLVLPNSHLRRLPSSTTPSPVTFPALSQPIARSLLPFFPSTHSCPVSSPSSRSLLSITTSYHTAKKGAILQWPNHRYRIGTTSSTWNPKPSVTSIAPEAVGCQQSPILTESHTSSNSPIFSQNRSRSVILSFQSHRRLNHAGPRSLTLPLSVSLR